MDKANLIISIIVVLCIATAVAAYGIINNDNPIFSELPNLGSGSGDSGNGVGNNSSHGSSASSGTGSGSGSGSGSSSHSGSGGGSGGGGSGGGGSSPSTYHTSAQIRAIASDHILQEGCYGGTPRYSDGYWYVTVYDASGNNVNTLVINDRTGMVSEG